MRLRILSELYPSATLTEDAEDSLDYLLTTLLQSREFPPTKGTLAKKLASLPSDSIREYLTKEILELAIHSQVDLNLSQKKSIVPLTIDVQSLYSGITQDHELYLSFLDACPSLILVKDINPPLDQTLLSVDRIQSLASEYRLRFDEWGLKLLKKVLALFLYNLSYYSEEEIELLKNEEGSGDLQEIILSSLFQQLEKSEAGHLLMVINDWNWIGFLNYTA